MNSLVSPRHQLAPLTYEHASGCWLHLPDGRRMLDASSGAICNNVGHAHPRVIEAIERQARRCAYAHPGQFAAREPALLADELCLRGRRPEHRVAFSCTGTTAVELAIAIARLYHRMHGEPTRTKILSSWLSYHGSSAVTLALSGHRRRRPPLAYACGDVPCIMPPFRGFHALQHPDTPCTAACADAVLTAIRQFGPSEIAAVLLEPVTGVTGGGQVPPQGYLDQVQRICREHGILVIHDEVMVGLGRAGAAFAADLCCGEVPDLCVVSKGLGAGYAAISAVLVHQSVVNKIFERGGVWPLSGTMAGNPLSAAVALSVLEILRELGVFNPETPEGRRFASRGEALGTSLRQALANTGCVREVRGIGYFWAVELSSGTLENALARTREQGLSMYPFNGYMPDGSGEGLLVAPPLIANDGELEFIIDRLAVALRDIRRCPEEIRPTPRRMQ